MIQILQKLFQNSAFSLVFIFSLFTLPLNLLATDTVPTVPETKEFKMTDDKITAFAKAQIAMHRIFIKYQPEMDKPNKTDQEKKDLQAKVVEEMGQALSAEGLTQEEYNEITKQAGQDKELYKRLSQEMVDVQKPITPPEAAAPAAPPTPEVPKQ